MEEKCCLCKQDAENVLTINVPSNKGIRQLITYLCNQHKNVAYQDRKAVRASNFTLSLQVISNDKKNYFVTNEALQSEIKRVFDVKRASDLSNKIKPLLKCLGNLSDNGNILVSTLKNIFSELNLNIEFTYENNR
jgi:hypothetical protein